MEGIFHIQKLTAQYYCQVEEKLTQKHNYHHNKSNTRFPEALPQNNKVIITNSDKDK